jgi:hypothetical protein
LNTLLLQVVALAEITLVKEALAEVRVVIVVALRVKVQVAEQVPSHH